MALRSGPHWEPKEAETVTTTLAGTTASRAQEAAWTEAENHITERLQALSRWDAERWAAAHERRFPPVTLLALQAWYTQAAIDVDRIEALAAGWDRLDAVIRARPWADQEPWTGDARQAVAEVTTAVVELARQALAAAILSDVLADRRPEARRRAIAESAELVRTSPLADELESPAADDAD